MIQKLLMGIVALIAFMCAGCTVPLEGAPVISPTGGYVFYDKGGYSDGWRYLEAAPKDAGEAKWDVGSPYTDLNTSEGIGSGKHNTELIVAHIVARGGSGTAAQLCDTFVYGGKDDWFLPSIDELEKMIEILRPQEIFWSSSESWGNSEAYTGEDYGLSIVDRDYKSYTHRVRPIRQF